MKRKGGPRSKDFEKPAKMVKSYQISNPTRWSVTDHESVVVPKLTWNCTIFNWYLIDANPEKKQDMQDWQGESNLKKRKIEDIQQRMEMSHTAQIYQKYKLWSRRGHQIFTKLFPYMYYTIIIQLLLLLLRIRLFIISLA
jgi:hypothetical protein